MLTRVTALGQDLRALLDGGGVEGEAVFEFDCGRTLRASKSVLCARCGHFRAMFTSGMRECADGGVVHVAGVPHDAFRVLLGYLLTDELPDETTAGAEVSAELALAVLMLANAYGVTRLEQICEGRLTRQLDAENVAEIARCAHLIGSRQLQRAADRFVRSSSANISAGISAGASAIAVGGAQ